MAVQNPFGSKGAGVVKSPTLGKLTNKKAAGGRKTTGK